ncbi:hypothetical protein AEM51_06135 [Bacteroidetes bacterium UKL13-3]|jgi:hypothetical protein|nr:hypothetical protein AEM51_06135 [Bacteroidetes bacterium UKL13-3]HCP92503.1 hypothetical protein [Bacteroidota bacterium]
MKRTLYTFAMASMVFACNNEPTPKASTDIVTNPVTADAPKPDTNQTTISAQSGAVIEFEKTDHDFGTITQGEQAEYNFKFRNTGKQDLLISSAQASCGCTVPEYSKEPIKPGAQGSIKVKFNSDYRLDAFEKAVVITANTTPLETVLKIRGFINPKPETGAKLTF